MIDAAESAFRSQRKLFGGEVLDRATYMAAGRSASGMKGDAVVSLLPSIFCVISTARSLLTLPNLEGIAAVSWLAREDQHYWWPVGTASDIFERSAFSHSRNFDQRRRPETLRTAMATAFFCPTSTTSRLPRVTPV